MNLKEYILINLEVMDHVSQELSVFLKKAPKPFFVFLEGDLGVGKTTFVQSVLKNLGIKERVKSPTYTLIEQYNTTEFLIYHLDLYRLQDARELENLGITDLFIEPALFFIEWPKQLNFYGIEPHLSMKFTLSPEGGRHLSLASSAVRFK
jgi:tRNA threonylcarbamoyladenosine biosynthesis protein TsaE